MSIRIGIIGYGNLGRGVECAIKQNPDMELEAVIYQKSTGKRTDSDKDCKSLQRKRCRAVER